MTQRILTFLVATLLSLGASAQGPNNTGTYYRNANGKSGQALKTALHNIIGNPSVTSYSGLYDAYKKTDKRPDGKVRDWYSNITNYDWDQHSNQREGSGWNREHSVPQSWFEGSTGTPKSDIVHVIPTDCWVNGMRSNYPLAEVGTIEKQSANGYSKLGTCKTPGYSGKVFEPNDEIKGDMARMYFYMVTCYEDKAVEWGHAVFSTVKYPGLQQWYLDMLMRWSKLDPIDEREIARNNAVFEVQNNRNPFVDYPGLEEYVWGSKKTEPFSYDQYEEGQGTVVTTVNPPVFSPDGGTFTAPVEVTMTTTTAGATIYYTTNGAEVSEQSKRYDGPITLSSTTTLRAIAVKDGTKSYQTVATFTINQGQQGGEEPVDGTIALNNEFFNCTYNGSISVANNEDLVGRQNGVTVVYALGNGGANRYCNGSEIRLYQNNTLTFSVDGGTLTSLEFELSTTTTKQLQASTGTVADYIWTGNAQQVVFNVNEGSGNIRLKSVKVRTNGATPVRSATVKGRKTDRYTSISGRRGSRIMKKDIYIQNGKKRLVR